MSRFFRISSEDLPTPMPFGTLRFLSSPLLVDARQLTVIDGVFAVGQGHSFHRHPDQEEVVFILEGTVEQWIEDEKRNLNAGDAAFIPQGSVHATFNVGVSTARLLAIFGPCKGDGFETVDMSDKAPWKELRT
jgi:quercetin dioxygenase-like cupin family protein